MKTHNPIHATLAVLLLAAACGPVSGAGPGADPAPPPLPPLLSPPGAAAPAAYPPRADVPLGAGKAEVCGRNDGDMRDALARYAASQGAQVNTSPSTNTRDWEYRDGVRTCRFCVLDGRHLSLGNETIAIVDSSAAGLQIGGSFFEARVRLRNVYARGAKLGPLRSIGAEHVDLRCSQMVGVVDWTSIDATDVDWSGAEGSITLTGPATDVRFTGAAASVELRGAVTDARLDGITGGQDVRFGPVRVGGTTRLDGSSWLNVNLDGTTFAGGKVTSAGGHGYLKVQGGVLTFDGVDLSELDGFLVYTEGGFPRIRAAGGTLWPVGARHIVPDEQLPQLDLSGARLVTRDARWPAAPLRLDGLRLTHGALPAGADLSLVSLDGAWLERVVFADATLTRSGRHASFRRAHLAQADLGGKAIDFVDFTLADLRGARLTGVTGSATFDQAQAGVLGPHVDDNDTDVPKITSLQRARLSSSTFRDAHLEHADLGWADLSDAHLEQAHLDWAQLQGATLQRGGNANPTLKEAASLHAVSLRGADLRGVDLSGADLGPAGGRGSSLAGALLCGATLRGAKLHDVDLSGALFDVDGEVRFPEGTQGACRPGDRGGADTSSVDSRLGTGCPDGGHAPEGADGMCTDAQWRVQGIPSQTCTDEERRRRRDIGGACEKDCQCKSAYCAPDRTCQEAPAKMPAPLPSSAPDPA